MCIIKMSNYTNTCTYIIYDSLSTYLVNDVYICLIIHVIHTVM